MAAHALKCLDFVQNHYQAGMARVPQDYEKSLQEAEGTVVVDVFLDTGIPLCGSGDIWLGHQPCEDPLGRGGVALRNRLPIATQCYGEEWRGPGDCGQPLSHEFVGPLQ